MVLAWIETGQQQYKHQDYNTYSVALGERERERGGGDHDLLVYDDNWSYF